MNLQLLTDTSELWSLNTYPAFLEHLELQMYQTPACFNCERIDFCLSYSTSHRAQTNNITAAH